MIKCFFCGKQTDNAIKDRYSYQFCTTSPDGTHHGDFADFCHDEYSCPDCASIYLDDDGPHPHGISILKIPWGPACS